MVGVTLAEIRRHVEELASDDGTYYVVCGRTGDRPVPAVGKRFDDRAAARAALRATEQYRTALRRYDPQVPYYDLIVCQDGGALGSSREESGGGADRSMLGSSLDGAVGTSERHALVECCHRVAASVFEALSDAGHDAVETAVMDAYLDLAETVDGPDELCLRLLESMATALHERLTPDEQAALLAGAATRLQPLEPTEKPLPATLSALRTHGLLGAYTQSPTAVDLGGGTRSTDVRLSEYALSPRDGRLPVLPIVLDLYRRGPDWRPSSVRAVDVDGGWQLTLVVGPGAEPAGLSAAPIRSGRG